MEESLHRDLADRHFFNSLAPNRDLICTGSSSNGLFVSLHFVSTGVTWYCAVASRSSTFSKTQWSPRYFNSCSRALRTACHGNSLPMTSSMHMTSCSSSSISAKTACFSRLRLVMPFLIHLHNFSSFWFLKFFNFQTFFNFSNSNSNHHDALHMLSFANFCRLSNF